MLSIKRLTRPRSIFVEPDPFTNQVIAEYLLTEEEHFHKDILCSDGSIRSVWEFGPLDKGKLNDLMDVPDVKMNFFVRNKGRNRPLESVSLEKGAVVV